MRGKVGHLPGSRLRRRAPIAAGTLALAALAACGGGSASDAADSLASMAAGAALVGELRVHQAVPAVYARQVLDRLRSELPKETDTLKKHGAAPGAASVLGQAERLDFGLAEMRSAVEMDNAGKLQAWVVQTSELAELLSTAARAMKGGAGG